jgi:hypothetical protein
MPRPRKEGAFEYSVMTTLDRADREHVSLLAKQRKCSLSQVLRTFVSASREAYERQLQAEQQAYWQAMAVQHQRGGPGA